MAWTDGPCALVLARRPFPETLGSDEILLPGAAALCLGLLLATLLATAPIVRRIRRLTQAVSDSAQSRYERPVGNGGRDEISQLARAFDEAGRSVRAHVDTIEARERTLREFVANTTHDVMLPLTVLQGHLAALRGAAEQGRPADGDAIRAAAEEAHYLGSILQNLAAVAKLEADDVHLALHPVDLSALVERVIQRHLPIARSAGTTLERATPPGPVWALGDVTLLEQAVSNVVHNALRHGRAGGHVAVVLEAPRGESRFRIRVVDDGPGIPEAEIPRLLERRERGVEARTRAPDGLGLGLSIAREVMHRHGFALGLSRSEAGGLEVRFSGPTAPAP